MWLKLVWSWWKRRPGWCERRPMTVLKKTSGNVGLCWLWKIGIWHLATLHFRQFNFLFPPPSTRVDLIVANAARDFSKCRPPFGPAADVCHSRWLLGTLPATPLRRSPLPGCFKACKHSPGSRIHHIQVGLVPLPELDRIQNPIWEPFRRELLMIANISFSTHLLYFSMLLSRITQDANKRTSGISLAPADFGLPLQNCERLTSITNCPKNISALLSFHLLTSCYCWTATFLFRSLLLMQAPPSPLTSLRVLWPIWPWSGGWTGLAPTVALDLLSVQSTSLLAMGASLRRLFRAALSLVISYSSSAFPLRPLALDNRVCGIIFLIQ